LSWYKRSLLKLVKAELSISEGSAFSFTISIYSVTKSKLKRTKNKLFWPKSYFDPLSA